VGAFAAVMCSSYFITKYYDQSISFPDFFSTFCTCLTDEGSCRNAKYACKWAPPPDMANDAVAAPSCYSASPDALANLSYDDPDALFLVLVLVLTLFGAPFQYKVTATLWGGSDAYLEEWEEELDMQAEELQELGKKARKTPKGDARNALIKQYKATKKAYERAYRYVQKMEAYRSEKHKHRMSLGEENEDKRQTHSIETGQPGAFRAKGSIETRLVDMHSSSAPREEEGDPEYVDPWAPQSQPQPLNASRISVHLDPDDIEDPWEPKPERERHSGAIASARTTEDPDSEHIRITSRNAQSTNTSRDSEDMEFSQDRPTPFV